MFKTKQKSRSVNVRNDLVLNLQICHCFLHQNLRGWVVIPTQIKLTEDKYAVSDSYTSMDVLIGQQQLLETGSKAGYWHVETPVDAVSQTHAAAAAVILQGGRDAGRVAEQRRRRRTEAGVGGWNESVMGGRHGLLKLREMLEVMAQ